MLKLGEMNFCKYSAKHFLHELDSKYEELSAKNGACEWAFCMSEDPGLISNFFNCKCWKTRHQVQDSIE